MAPDPEPEPEPEPVVVERVVETRRGGLFPALLGGVLAACLGFAAGQTGLLDSILPGAQQQNEELSKLQTQISATTEKLVELETAVQSSATDLGPLNNRIDKLDGAVTEVSKSLDGRQQSLADTTAALTELNTRLTSLEKRPIDEGVSQQAIVAYEREIAALSDTVTELRSEVEQLLENAHTLEASARDQQEAAEAAARLAERHSKVARLRSVAAIGSPFAVELADAAALGLDIPAVVESAAETGVTSVTTLAEMFPDVARDALAAARSEDPEKGGLAGYLQRQLGARSVTPREGDDADAVLSRVESAVQNGDIPKAMELIATLPEVAQAEMADWLILARTRVDVLAALDGLLPSNGSN